MREPHHRHGPWGPQLEPKPIRSRSPAVFALRDRWLDLGPLRPLMAVLAEVVVGPVIGLVGGAWLAARFAAYDALDATLSRWGSPGAPARA